MCDTEAGSQPCWHNSVLGVMLAFWITISGSPCFGVEPSGFPPPIGFLRPSSEALFQGISDGASFSSTKNRHAAAELVRVMDNEHMNQLSYTDTNICRPEAFNSWVKTKTPESHPLMPPSERALISALVLQVEILDIILGNTDTRLRETLKNKRTMIRIKNKSDSFFSDSRDNYICVILTLSEQIYDLQSALGVTGDATSWEFPKDAGSFSAVENYLVEKIRCLKNRAHKLICK